MNDKEVIEILNELSEAYEATGNPYKARPFAIASKNLDKDIRGVGKSTRDEIAFIRKHGYSRRLRNIKKSPQYKSYKKFLGILGVGSVSASLLVSDGARTLNDAMKSQYLPEIGKLGIKYYDDLNSRHSRKSAKGLIAKIAKSILAHGEKMIPLGSFRRQKATVGDLDILIYSNKIPAPRISVMDEFIAKIRGGDKAYSCLMDNAGKAIRVDFFLCPHDVCPAYVQYGTGSAEHNEYLRTVAKEKGYKLNQYGLFKENGTPFVLNTERDIYRILDVPYVEPQNR